MKIGMVVDNEFYGDPRVFNEAKILNEAGFKVSILCFNFGKYPVEEEINGINIYRITIDRRLKNILFALMNSLPIYHYLWAKHIKWFINQREIDTLHVHDLYMVKAAHLAAKHRNISIVLDLHENYPAAIMGYKWATKFPKNLFVQPRKWKKLEGRYLGYANKIIVLSEDFRDNLISIHAGLNNDKFIIYPNIPDISELNSYKIDDRILDTGKSFIIFYFGGISERRGIFTCFKALKILVEKKYDIKLLIIGPIDKADVKSVNSYLTDDQISKQIIYYPWKDISTLPSYILKSNVCLSPIVKNEQHESGVANKVFQYMLFERPVIVSDCIPQARVIENEKCGMVFRSENADDLAGKVETLIKNPNLCFEMGKNGKQAVLLKYNVDAFKQNLLFLYNELKKTKKKEKQN
jgi:glycosyltransferase involved in cell wall biosynthesis